MFLTAQYQGRQVTLEVSQAALYDETAEIEAVLEIDGQVHLLTVKIGDLTELEPEDDLRAIQFLRVFQFTNLKDKAMTSGNCIQCSEVTTKRKDCISEYHHHFPIEGSSFKATFGGNPISVFICDKCFDAGQKECLEQSRILSAYIKDYADDLTKRIKGK